MPSSPQWLSKPENQEKLKLARLNWKLKNPNYKRNRDPNKVKEYKSSDPLYRRKFSIKQKYNLTWDMFLELHTKQSGKCGVCEIEIPAEHPDTVVDHCHTTGAIRGLLCRKCNMGLGLFQDSLTNIQKAQRYLEQFYAVPN